MDLVVAVPRVVVQDGRSADVRTGDIGALRLCFVEENDVEENDMASSWRVSGAVGTFEFDVRPRSGADADGGAVRPVPTDVYGDGFDAFWAAPRRIDGAARLRGHLCCDLLYGGSPVTGRVSRIDLVTETARRRPDDPSRWEWESTRTRQLEAIPDRFDDGLVRGEERYPGVFTTVRPDPWVSEIGVVLHIGLPA